jgi:hypothetical protein
MRFVDQSKLLEVIASVSAARLIHTIEEGLKIEQLHLDANEVLGNRDKCIEIENRICDSKLFLTFLYLRQSA